MRTLVPCVAVAAFFLGAAQEGNRMPVLAPATTGELACAPLGRPYLRTTLYFGLNQPAGTVSEGQWRTFLQNEVSLRFPEGLTVWEANGQWRRPDGRISRERAKVLLLVHEDTAAHRTNLAALVSIYKRSFQQESVLWETSTVCAAF